MHSSGYMELVEKASPSCQFLLERLFGVAGQPVDLSQGDRAKTRACLNSPGSRNLERYIDLIIQLKVPEPKDTHIFYKSAVEELIAGRSIVDVLDRDGFDLSAGNDARTQFWEMLAAQAHRLKGPPVHGVLSTAIEGLPEYSAMGSTLHPSNRYKVVRAIAKIMDRSFCQAGPDALELENKEPVVCISHRIFGEGGVFMAPLLEDLVTPSRGILGWQDLLYFRQQCSLDRGGQLNTLNRALMAREGEEVYPSDTVPRLTRDSMRFLSQSIFSLFDKHYIQRYYNFFRDIEALDDRAVVGFSSFDARPEEYSGHTHAIDKVKNDLGFYIAYQLSNRVGPSDAGIGCGYYDRSGANDKDGIHELMSDYLLSVCFEPAHDPENINRFVRFFLWMLEQQSGAGIEEARMVLPSGPLLYMFPQSKLYAFWIRNKSLIRKYIDSQGETVMLKGHLTIHYRRHWRIISDYLDTLAPYSPNRS